MAMDTSKRPDARKRFLTRLIRSESGAVAIEFGILALPFFALLGAIMQSAVVFLTAEVFDSAVKDASRQIRTGQVQNAGFDLDQFRGLVCDHTFGLMDCSAIFFRIDRVDSFSVADATVPIECDEDEGECEWSEAQTFKAGGGSDVILIEAYYRQSILVDLGLNNLGNLADGTRLLSSVHLFQNEPFGG